MGEVISIVIPTKNNGGVLERCMSSIEGLDCHAGVAETRGRRSGDRTAGLLRGTGRVVGLRKWGFGSRGVILEHVLMVRGTMMGLMTFLVGFVCALYRLLDGCGCVDLPVVVGGEG